MPWGMVPNFLPTWIRSIVLCNTRLAGKRISYLFQLLEIICSMKKKVVETILILAPHQKHNYIYK
jgi:hypothetical protein